MAVSDNINYWSDNGSQQSNSSVTQDHFINTDPGTIANIDAMSASHDGGEHFTFASNPADAAIEHDIGLDNEIAMAQSKMQALLMENEALLSMLEPGSKEYEQAAASCSAIQMGIAQLSAASQGGAATKTAALGYVATTFNVGNATPSNLNAQKNAESAAYAYQQQREAEEAERIYVQQQANYAADIGIAGLDSNANNHILGHLQNTSPELLRGLTADRLFNSDPVFNEIKEEQQDLNAAALDRLRTDPEFMNDPDVRAKLDRLQAVINRNERFTEEEIYFIHNAVEEYDQAIANGQSHEEAMAAMNNQLEEGLAAREQAARDIAQAAVDALPSDAAKTHLIGILGQNATNEDLQQLLKDRPVNNEEFNHAQFFINKRIEELTATGMSREQAEEEAFKLLQEHNPSWADNYTLGFAKATSEIGQINYNLKELYENLGPEQLQQVLDRTKELIREGKYDEALAGLTVGGDYSPEVIETMKRSMRDRPEDFIAMLNSSSDDFINQRTFSLERTALWQQAEVLGIDVNQLTSTQNPQALQTLAHNLSDTATNNFMVDFMGGTENNMQNYTIDYSWFENADDIALIESTLSDVKNINFVKSEALDNLVDSSQQHVAPENAAFANALAGTEFDSAEFGFASDFSFAVSDVQDVGSPTTVPNVAQDQQFAYAR